MSFKLNLDGDIEGTSRTSEIVVSYPRMIEVFGEPVEGDGYKVSGEWVFQNEETGEVFTLYDWKSTNLYDSDYLSVSELRADESVWLNIGSHGDNAAAFKTWLESKLGD